MGLAALAALCQLWAVSSAGAADEFEKYGIESASVSLSSLQAGAHADMTIALELTEKEGQPYAKTRDLSFDLPPGVIGNPQAVPRCSVAELGETIYESECPVASQVGIAEIKVGAILNNTFFEPLYNMLPPQDGSTV